LYRRRRKSRPAHRRHRTVTTATFRRGRPITVTITVIAATFHRGRPITVAITVAA